MRWMVETSLQFRFLVVTVAAALLFFGVTGLRQMPMDVLPEFAPPYIEVQTEALGLSAVEVESLISLNLEELLNGLPWRQTIRSRSVPGLSSVTLIFEPGTDVMRARQLVAERLTQTFMLPNVSKAPVILQPLSATSRVVMIGLSSRDVSPIEMSVLAQWAIRPALLSVPGVANVSIWGQRERQLQVQVDPEHLRANNVGLDQIVETAGDALWVSPLAFLNASTPGTGGFIDTPQQRLEVRHVLPISTGADMAQVAVVDAPTTRLGDVAQIVEGHQALIGDAALRDGPGLLLVVEKFPGANTLEVTRGVEAKLDALRPGLQGITIDSTLFRPATFLESAISNLTGLLLLGSVLLILVLLGFLFEWRVALISFVAIPSSLVAALLVLYARGETANVMVLAGLMVAIGAIVDDAVIDIDNIARRLRQGRRDGSDRSAASIILHAAVEMRSPILFATLIMLLAVSPLFFVEGLTGSLVHPLALSYALAVLASMVAALMMTPALSVILLSGAPLERREAPFIPWLQRSYSRLLGRAVRRPRPLFVALGVTAALGLALLPSIGQGLLPSFRESQLLIQWKGAPGTSLPEMARITSRASRELQSLPGVRNVATQLGRAILGDQVVGADAAQLWVTLDPQADRDTTVAAITDTVDGYPGMVHDVQTYLQQTLRQTVTGSSDAIVVRIYGPEFGVLTSKAEEVGQVLSKVDGVADLHTELQVEEPNVQITVDLEKAERYGLKPGDVRRAASTVLAGIHVNSLFEQQKVFDVMVWGTPDTRDSLTDIRELLIDTPSGGHVRLQDVADVRIAPALTSIDREAISRRIDVGLNVRGRDVGSAMADIHRALQGLSFPLEYRAELLSEYAERQADQQRVLIAGLVALIGVFLLLQATFQSWRLATLAIVTLPWSLLGGLVAAFLVGGGTMSVASLLGLLTILGVATRNSIVLIQHYQRLEEQGAEAFGPELVLRGSAERLAPILTTALATAVAVVPLAIAGSIPGNEMLRPLAVVILGGLVTSTLLNLFVMPVLYLRAMTGLRGGLARSGQAPPIPAV